MLAGRRGKDALGPCGEHVLGKRVESERPRNHLDLRHRVDKEGARYGKILDFRLSELRVFELLDKLSSEFDAYEPDEQEGTTRWLHRDQLAGNRTKIPEDELTHRRRALKRWCESAIELHEDAITDLLRSDALSRGSIQDTLCTKLTKACEEGGLTKAEL